jgi:hypothetical protein
VSGFGHLSSIVEIARFELQNFTVQAKELAQRLVWSLPGLSCTSISHRDSCRAHHKLMLPMAKYSARSCPRCDGYLGTALREPERNTRRQAVNGHCVRWSCRMAWIVIEGDGPKNKRTDSHGSVPNILGTRHSGEETRVRSAHPRQVRSSGANREEVLRKKLHRSSVPL